MITWFKKIETDNEFKYSLTVTILLPLCCLCCVVCAHSFASPSSLPNPYSHPLALPLPLPLLSSLTAHESPGPQRRNLAGRLPAEVEEDAAGGDCLPA